MFDLRSLSVLESRRRRLMTFVVFSRLFGRAFFDHLGLGPGSALLAGISLSLMPIFFVSLDCPFVSATIGLG